MGAVGTVALLANVLSFGLLWAYREGDANMRSAWVCTRNDALGNLAVLLAALGVFGTGAGWPDLIVVGAMAALALQGAAAVIKHAVTELTRKRSKQRPTSLRTHFFASCAKGTHTDETLGDLQREVVSPGGNSLNLRAFCAYRRFSFYW
jgi:Co/Zn/Cd efflux system component